MKEYKFKKTHTQSSLANATEIHLVRNVFSVNSNNYIINIESWKHFKKSFSKIFNLPFHLIDQSLKYVSVY